jgi:hypothetical protein
MAAARLVHPVASTILAHASRSARAAGDSCGLRGFASPLSAADVATIARSALRIAPVYRAKSGAGAAKATPAKRTLSPEAKAKVPANLAKARAARAAKATTA